eukprot:scaffold8179_cov126-Skeletonema_marinoi.AAC.4
MAGIGATAIRHRYRNHLSFLDVDVDEKEMEGLLRMKKHRMSMMLTTTVSTTSSQTTPAAASACNLTPQVRAAKFRQMAIQIAGTPAATLNNENSPQAQALDWISNKDQMNPPLCPSDEPEALQRYIMAAFYFATGGGSWKECIAPTDTSPAAIAAANQNCSIEATKYPIGDRKYGTDAWLTPKPICDWAGLVCHIDDERKGTLDQIDFEGNNLSGSLIDEIGLLKNLRFLILEQGTIEGEIPESIGNLPLLIVDLDFNRLIGPIPPSLYNIKSLLQLDLNDNQMTGLLSSDVKHWQKMTYLQLNNNAFTGIIPSELGQLQKLREYNLCPSLDGRPLLPQDYLTITPFSPINHNRHCILPRQWIHRKYASISMRQSCHRGWKALDFGSRLRWTKSSSCLWCTMLHCLF